MDSHAHMKGSIPLDAPEPAGGLSEPARLRFNQAVRPTAGPNASQEIILLDEVLEEAPTPRALPRPRPMSRPRPGVPDRLGDFTVTRTYHSGMVDGVFLAYKSSQHGLATQAVLKWARRGRPDYDIKREVLLDEARALSLIHHPGIVRFLDSNEDEGGCYIAIEYVPGTDLRAVLSELARNNLRMPTSMACYVAQHILRALDHAHRAVDESGAPLDIVHRDVTPSNILIAHDGHLKLTDFGVVRMRNRQQRETMPGLVKGKFRYMAPEYVSGSTPSPRSDLYAVGVTLFELFTGQHAFNQEGRQNIFKQIMEQGLDLEPMRLNGIPENLVQLVARATHRDPNQRFASAGAMADALEMWLAREGTYVSSTALAVLLRRLSVTEPSLDASTSGPSL